MLEERSMLGMEFNTSMATIVLSKCNSMLFLVCLLKTFYFISVLWQVKKSPTVKTVHWRMDNSSIVRTTEGTVWRGKALIVTRTSRRGIYCTIQLRVFVFFRRVI